MFIIKYNVQLLQNMESIWKMQIHSNQSKTAHMLQRHHCNTRIHKDVYILYSHLSYLLLSSLRVAGLLFFSHVWKYFLILISLFINDSHIFVATHVVHRLGNKGCLYVNYNADIIISILVCQLSLQLSVLWTHTEAYSWYQDCMFF